MLTSRTDPSPALTVNIADVERKRRFAFGRNWARFVPLIDEERIASAEQSLRERLKCARLDGRSFLDIGSGSGLFSLAAFRLGARVVSFDFDGDSVACTEELRRRFGSGAARWQVLRGSVLDSAFLEGLGRFDVVYSWGVLHHTGAMWMALDNAARRCAPGGQLFIAIYNDQGKASRRWRAVKRLYVEGPAWLRPLVLIGAAVRLEAKQALLGWLGPVAEADKKPPRGMSKWRDLVDWVGGYPFEVASPSEVTAFARERGFELQNLVERRGRGCNEFVFSLTRSEGAPPAPQPASPSR